jgi:hypothetical protein
LKYHKAHRRHGAIVLLIWGNAGAACRQPFQMAIDATGSVECMKRIKSFRGARIPEMGTGAVVGAPRKLG